MSRHLRRLAACTAAAVVTLTVAACGGEGAATVVSAPSGLDARTADLAATTDGAVASPEPAAAAPAATARPRVAAPDVAPLDVDESVLRQYGDPQPAETAYRELVELSSRYATDPRYFFRDGDNSPDDLAPVLAHLTPELAATAQDDADGCLALDPESCTDLVGIAWFDNGTPERPYTFRDDLEFIPEQSITDARAVAAAPEDGAAHLKVSFDHTVHVRFLIAGTPARVTLTRTVAYDLVPAPGTGPGTWQIADWTVDAMSDDLVDDVTGQPIAG